MVALRDYKLQADELPSGYAIDSEQAFGNEAQAVESTTRQPPDPRPADALLEPLEASGRVVRVRQVLNKPGEPEAAELLFNVVLFRAPEGAESALKDPSLVLFTPPDLEITTLAQAPIGDGASAFQLDTLNEVGEVEDRARAVFWRRGRVAFAVVASGPPVVADAAASLVAELAQRADTRLATLPPLPAPVAAPTWMPPVQARLGLYRALVDRTLPDDAFVGFQSPGVDTIGNAELLNDGPRLAEAPISDPAVLRERLLERERRILGIHKEYLPVPEAADPPDTRFPSLASGYHLYADADGAREALAASAAEIALRMIEAIPVPTPTLGEITPPLRLGEETRALTGRVRFDDGLEVEVTTLRWRRGSVELYADVAAAAGADLGELLVRLAQQHDAVYAANPLPAR
ncbi:MAG: hypothetical protein H0V51_21010 [Chloroflexi bacterium]|nr:hypothetical protein [Chloroflexota bacterium]